MNILGTDYKIVSVNDDSLSKQDISGQCNFITKEILVNEHFLGNREDYTEEEANIFRREIIRHEMVHAFLYESGLNSSSVNEWARNEEMIDYFAIQLPKMFKVMQENEVI